MDGVEHARKFQDASVKVDVPWSVRDIAPPDAPLDAHDANVQPVVLTEPVPVREIVIRETPLSDAVMRVALTVERV